MSTNFKTCPQHVSRTAAVSSLTLRLWLIVGLDSVGYLLKISGLALLINPEVFWLACRGKVFYPQLEFHRFRSLWSMSGYLFIAQSSMNYVIPIKEEVLPLNCTLMDFSTQYSCDLGTPAWCHKGYPFKNVILFKGVCINGVYLVKNLKREVFIGIRNCS